MTRNQVVNILLGVGAGLAGAWLLGAIQHRCQGPGPAPDAPPSKNPAVTAGRVRNAEADSRIGLPPTVPQDDDSEDETEENQVRWANRVQEHLDRLEAGSPNDPWAVEARGLFKKELETALPPETHVAQLRCQGRVCLAELTWPNYQAAREDARVLLYHQYTRNCARLVYIPPPEDESEVYGGKAVFDCSDQ